MTYKITNSFSQQMAASIPKKIKSWLETITESADSDFTTLLPHGSFGRLSWQLSHGDSLCGVYLDQQPVILWNSELELDQAAFCSNNIELTDIANNLDYFIDLELQIYAEMEKLQEELNKHEYLKTKEQEYTQYLKVEDEKH